MIRVALLELRRLHRLCGPWVGAAILVWILAALLQEPPFFRRHGVHVFWGSVTGCWLLVAVLVPLLWTLSSRHACALGLRYTEMGAPLGLALAPWLFGALLTASSWAVALALDLVRGLEPPAGLVPIAAHSLGLLALLCAGAPALATRRPSLPTTAAAWLAALLLLTWTPGLPPTLTPGPTTPAAPWTTWLLTLGAGCALGASGLRATRSG